MLAKMARGVGEFSPPIWSQVVDFVETRCYAQLPVELGVLSQKGLFAEVI
jgi:hypothetical protein